MSDIICSAYRFGGSDSRLLRFPLQKFPPHEKAGNHKPYNHGVAALALFLLLVCSPIIEHFLFDNALSESLPVGAGGLVGLLAGSGLAWLLGKSGSLLIMLVMLLLSISLLAQVSWLEVMAKSGSRYGRPVWQFDEKTVSIPK